MERHKNRNISFNDSKFLLTFSKPSSPWDNKINSQCRREKEREVNIQNKKESKKGLYESRQTIVYTSNGLQHGIIRELPVENEAHPGLCGSERPPTVQPNRTIMIANVTNVTMRAQSKGKRTWESCKFAESPKRSVCTRSSSVALLVVNNYTYSFSYCLLMRPHPRARH